VSGISVFILTAGRTAKSLGHILLTGQSRRRPPEPLARPLREAFQRDDCFVNLLSLLAQVRKFFELRVIRRAWYIDVLIGKISSMTSNSGEIMEALRAPQVFRGAVTGLGLADGALDVRNFLPLNCLAGWRETRESRRCSSPFQFRRSHQRR
jgi:hypothetical protein